MSYSLPEAMLASPSSLKSPTSSLSAPNPKTSIESSSSINECHAKDACDNADSMNYATVVCQCQSHLGRVLLNKIYPFTTEKIFTMLFSSVPWYHHLQNTVRKTAHGKMLNAVTEYVTTSWLLIEPALTTRTATYIMALNNAIGPKSTSVTEKQTCSEFGNVNDGFTVIKEIQNAGIPCADSFTVRCTYCIIRVDGSHCRILVHGAIMYNKSMWSIVRGLIEKSTYDGLESHYAALDETLTLLSHAEKPKGNDEALITKCETKVRGKVLNGYANIDISTLSCKVLQVSKDSR
ncbi:unnamed protein product [Thelazia callipaeda]|uniref:VASt domain-containing protein n=1 Tax=Thelazia callipaeda TaxID=103827 RepID=A0A0N5CJ66_THECL|nr:unnamed protein product [Thelazia callipaeda]